jgi:hypothetical protein
MISNYQLYLNEEIILQENILNSLKNFKMPEIPKNFNFKKTFDNIQTQTLNFLNKHNISKKEIDQLISSVKKEINPSKDPKKVADNITLKAKNFIAEKIKSDQIQESLGEKIILCLQISVAVMLINSIVLAYVTVSQNAKLT